MTDEEHEAAKEAINEKIKALSLELGRLTGEIMNLENSPVVKATISIFSVMGMAEINTRIQIPPVEIINEINEKVNPEELKKVFEDIFREAKEQADVATMEPDEQVEDLLKQMRNRGNQN